MAKKKKTKKRRRKRTTDEAIPTTGRRKKINGIEFYEVDNALDTLTRSFEIQKDERLMEATEKLLKKRQVALDKVERSLETRSKK